MRSVTSKSAITPSLSGRIATMLPGVRPIIRFASTPTATICPLFVLSATTEGSLSTIPRPRTYTRVFAVPRSTAMSRPRNDKALLITNETFQDDTGWLYSGAAIGNPPAGPQPCDVVHRPLPRRLNELREKDLDFPGRRVRRVRAVHDVLRNLQRVIAPDRARSSGNRIGRARQRAERLDRARPLRDQGHQRAGRDELDERAEERLAGVLGVVQFGGLTVQRAQVHAHNPQSLAFEPGDHGPDQAPADAIRLDQDQGAVRQRSSLGCS